MASIIKLMDELYNTYILQFNILQFNILVSEAEVVQGLLTNFTLVIASNDVNNLRLEDLPFFCVII